MYRKVLAGGLTAAAILGAGGTALALTGSDSASGGSGASSTALADRSGLGGRAKLLKRLSHAQITVRTKKGFVTHDLIRGKVTHVSPTSITVQAADKTSETFVVNGDTKVRMRANGHGTASSISAVHEGDAVLVAGTGTTTYVAKHVVDVKGKSGS